MTDIQSESPATLERVEHNHDAGSKRVQLRAQDPASGSWVNVSAIDNGDGTFSLKDESKGFAIPQYDNVTMTNADANGNYQTITFKKNSTTVKTLTLAYDGSNNITSIAST